MVCRIFTITVKVCSHIHNHCLIVFVFSLLQPYRTTPLVLPGAKVKRDAGPTECYLRHHPNPSVRAAPHHLDGELLLKQKVFIYGILSNNFDFIFLQLFIQCLYILLHLIFSLQLSEVRSISFWFGVRILQKVLMYLNFFRWRTQFQTDCQQVIQINR